MPKKSRAASRIFSSILDPGGFAPADPLRAHSRGPHDSRSVRAGRAFGAPTCQRSRGLRRGSSRPFLIRGASPPRTPYALTRGDPMIPAPFARGAPLARLHAKEVAGCVEDLLVHS